VKWSNIVRMPPPNWRASRDVNCLYGNDARSHFGQSPLVAAYGHLYLCAQPLFSGFSHVGISLCDILVPAFKEVGRA